MATLSTEDIEALKDIKDMGKEICNTKDRIMKLEELYIGKLEKLEERIIIHEDIDRKVDRLVNPKLITINAGGKLFRLSKDLIINTPYNNILQNQLEGNRESDQLFVDCSKKCFNVILQLLRLGNEPPESMITSSMNCYFAEMIKKEVYLEYYLKSFFLNSSCKLFENFKIKSSYVPNNLVENISYFHLSKPNEDPEFIHKTNQHYSDIFNDSNNKAFFLDKNSDLVIEFTTEIRICSINLKPYNGKKTNHFDSVRLLKSQDGKDWKYITKLVEESKEYSFKFSHVNLKFIKIETVKQISIGRLKFE